MPFIPVLKVAAKYVLQLSFYVSFISFEASALYEIQHLGLFF